jgi:CSLREA domain-containing protein
MRGSLLLLSFLAARAFAAGPTFTVNSAADDHDAVHGDGKCETSSQNVCTLRAAIEEANTTTEATVQLPAGTITLSNGVLTVAASMSIVGAGVGSTAVSGNDLTQVFLVSGGGLTVTFRALTIRDGRHDGFDGAGIGFGGGGSGLVTIDACVITHCFARYGGAIESNSPLVLTNTSITDCHANDAAGEAHGGALWVVGNTTLTGCTLSGNTAKTFGAAIYTYFGTVNLVNCTVSGNSAGSQGGGIYVDSPSGAGPAAVGLYNTTVADNVGSVQGGGIVNATGTASNLLLVNSIVTGNGRASGQILIDDDCSGPVLSSGDNIVVTVDAAHCTVSGVYSTAFPEIGLLSSNGGPTKTRALLDNSPAKDAGPSLGCTMPGGAPLTIDQRGVHRPIGAKCDLGAYERSPCGDANGDGSIDIADVFFLINFLFAGGPLPPGLANVNEDSAVDIADVFYLINALFAGGPAPSCPGT